MQQTALSLADLETFDPMAPARTRERRFLCPLCGTEKPRDAGHRTVCVNTETGAWQCHRCHQAGKLREHWDPPRDRNRNWAGRPVIKRHAYPATPRVETTPAEPAIDWRVKTEGAAPLEGTPGAEYLAGRGIPPELAAAAGVRYHPAFCSRDRPAVLFELRDVAGIPQATHGRYIDGRTDPKGRDVGRKGRCVFATPGALAADPVILVEGPTCALSLHAAGFPAVALMGGTLPAWIPEACAWRRVWIAADADGPGDTAAGEWAAKLRSLGAKVERVRPRGSKDWNELLQRDGVEALRAALLGLSGEPAGLTAIPPDIEAPEAAPLPESPLSEMGEAFPEAGALPDDEEPPPASGTALFVEQILQAGGLQVEPHCGGEEARLRGAVFSQARGAGFPLVKTPCGTIGPGEADWRHVCRYWWTGHLVGIGL